MAGFEDSAGSEALGFEGPTAAEALAGSEALGEGSVCAEALAGFEVLGIEGSAGTEALAGFEGSAGSETRHGSRLAGGRGGLISRLVIDLDAC